MSAIWYNLFYSDSQVPHMLRARSLVFRSGNETEYKAAKYWLEKAITVSKRQYRGKLDGFYSTADSRLKSWVL